MAEPTIVISRPYARNFNTEPNTIEIPFERPWEFACRWTRQNASQQPFLAIDVPAQRGYSNCQFGFAGKPPQCTPSSVQFAADTAGQQQSSNVTCQESGNSLTCSISLEVFNPRHVGLWSCRSLSDNRNDSAYLQYYKVLPEESLVLASWDPISPSNWTSSTSATASSVNSSATESPSNRFECFTKKAAIPPPRLAFYLGGIELTSEQTRYPVEWLFSTEYSTEPRMFTLNGTETKKDPPRKDLSLNQQLLASSRILFIRLHRSYNSLLLECRATQNLVSGRTITKSIVLHLDFSNRASTLRIISTTFGLAAWLTAVLMKFTLI
uniref:Ig-like domain-containing protein n=1 Tax=Macrostomum lignano TaxID=282301 RepID=A0A1I8IE56_9PLAT